VKLFYLHTSAWIKRYVTEPGSAPMEAIFAARAARASSTLGYIEAHAALAHRIRQGGEEALLSQALLDVSEDWRDFLRIRISDAIAENARSHAVELGLAAADAIHLASALALARRKPEAFDEVVFAAADLELLAAAGRLGLPVWNPEDEG
jgi:predicted nucleic acid-binding protein